MKKVLMMHGINHNMFGHRDEKLYGSVTYEEINERMEQKARELGVKLEIFQSNFEGEFVERVHKAFFEKTDAVIVNPGGWTNYTIGIKDALAILKCPLIEVHMSNTFRKHGGTVRGDTTMLASGILIGMGAKTYTLALQAAAELIEERGGTEQ